MTDSHPPISGYAALIGYEVIERARDVARLRLRLGPQHLNRMGIPHGGVIATLLDTALGLAAAFADGPERPQAAVTLNLAVSYIGQAGAGETVIAEGRRIGGGRSVAFAAGAVTDEGGRLIARGEGVFKYVRKRE